jgi:hypothetical protein
MTSDFYPQAVEKLDKELKAGKFDRYGAAMKQAVHDALLDFCGQDGEFAQAVVQGGSFQDCMTAVGKCVKGSSISDMEAYGAAVRFYFPGAEIRVTMRIDLLAGVRGDEPIEPDKPEGLVVDLSDFF